MAIGAAFGPMIPAATATAAPLTGGLSLLPALISGGASLLGGILGNESSAKQASKQRRWQEYMSNTAHQREATDLYKAGLNPILTATGGKGASTPSGAMAQQSDVLTPAVATAQHSRRLTKELDLLREQISREASTTDLNVAATGKNQADARLSDQLNAESQEREAGIKATADLTREQERKTEQERKNLAQQEWSHHYQALADRFLPGVASSSAAQAENRKRFEQSDFGMANPFVRFLIEILRGTNELPGPWRR